MKKKYDFTNSESVLKELELLKTDVEKLSKRMGACETSLPEEIQNATSLVRSLAQLKGKYKEYETVYNDIVSKTGAISGFAQSAEKSAETIRDITDDIQELSDKADEIKNAATQYYFNVGERVFHEKLGIGHITDVIQIGESTMYTIDFGKMGKKAMDASYAHLKKF